MFLSSSSKFKLGFFLLWFISLCCMSYWLIFPFIHGQSVWFLGLFIFLSFRSFKHHLNQMKWSFAKGSLQMTPIFAMMIKVIKEWNVLNTTNPVYFDFKASFLALNSRKVMLFFSGQLVLIASRFYVYFSSSLKKLMASWMTLLNLDHLLQLDCTLVAQNTWWSKVKQELLFEGRRWYSPSVICL